MLLELTSPVSLTCKNNYNEAHHLHIFCTVHCSLPLWVGQEQGQILEPSLPSQVFLKTERNYLESEIAVVVKIPGHSMWGLENI